MDQRTPTSSRPDDDLAGQVAELRRELEQLRGDLSAEVRTRRLVVEGPDGFERIVGEALLTSGMLRVECKSAETYDTYAALVASEEFMDNYVEVQLSVGGNTVAEFAADEGHGAKLHVGRLGLADRGMVLTPDGLVLHPQRLAEEQNRCRLAAALNAVEEEIAELRR